MSTTPSPAGLARCHRHLLAGRGQADAFYRRARTLGRGNLREDALRHAPAQLRPAPTSDRSVTRTRHPPARVGQRHAPLGAARTRPPTVGTSSTPSPAGGSVRPTAPQQLHDHYVIVNFAQQTFRTIAVCRDILTRYNVDASTSTTSAMFRVTFDAKVRACVDPETPPSVGRASIRQTDARQLHAQMHAWRTNSSPFRSPHPRRGHASPPRRAPLPAAVWRSRSLRDTCGERRTLAQPRPHRFRLAP